MNNEVLESFVQAMQDINIEDVIILTKTLLLGPEGFTDESPKAIMSLARLGMLAKLLERPLTAQLKGAKNEDLPDDTVLE